MGGKADPPQMPDYAGLMRQQINANRADFQTQTQASRPDVFTPYGSSTWSQGHKFNNERYTQDALEYQNKLDQWNQMTEAQQAENKKPEAPNQANYYDPTWSNKTELSPQEQQAYDSRMSLAQSLRDRAQGEQTPQTPTWNGPQYDAGTGQRYVDQTFKAFHDRMDPIFQTQDRRLTDKLQQQGFAINSDAVNEQTKLQDQKHSDAYQQMLAQAMQTGSALNTDELNRGLSASKAGFDAGMTTAGFQAQEQHKQLADALGALQGNTGGSQVPGVTSAATPTLSTPNMLSIAEQQYGNQIGAYNAQTAGQATTTAALLNALGNYYSKGNTAAMVAAAAA